MDIAIGLPVTIPGLQGNQLIDWARRAEGAGFSGLGTVDNVIYDSYEPLIALAAAASVTERLRLITNVIVAPVRSNHVLFAKQAATLDRISNGRLVLGLGVGARPADYERSGLDFHRRGRDFDRQIETLKRVWQGEGGVGPPPFRPGGPPIIIGGNSAEAMRRAAVHADGWIAGAAGPAAFPEGAERAKAAWEREGRHPSKPRLMAICYYSLGPNALEAARKSLLSYYAALGPQAEMMVSRALITPETLKEGVATYEAAGCDEVIFYPCSTDIEQVDLLAEAVLGG